MDSHLAPIDPESFAGLTVVAVHAHPDDEALFTGGVLASAVAHGADVHVITCTLGEEGEVFDTTLLGLTADHADQLGGFRYHELQASVDTLGATGHFLGGVGYWRDSGMEGPTRPDRRTAFIHSGEEAVTQLQELFDELHPDIIITYDENGTYGHRDHIRVYEVVMATQCSWQPQVWCVVTDPTHPVTDVLALDHSAYMAKVVAMAAHATQIQFAQHSQGKLAEFALTNRLPQQVSDREFFQRVQ